MCGWVSPAAGLTHEAAAESGKTANSTCLFTLTVVTPNVTTMVNDPRHRSPAFGMMLIPALSDQPLAVENGFLDLFIDHAPRVVHMRYELRLAATDGRHYTLRGIKEIVRRSWFPTSLSDTTTLFVDLYEGEKIEGEPKLRGMMWMGPGAVFMQGLTFRGSGSWFGVAAIAEFARYYVARCLYVYLGNRIVAPRVDWAKQPGDFRALPQIPAVQP